MIVVILGHCASISLYVNMYESKNNPVQIIKLHRIMVFRSAQNKGILYFVVCLYSSNYKAVFFVASINTLHRN